MAGINEKQIRIDLPTSKSITNRALILSALSHGKITLENCSTANDSLVLQKALAHDDYEIDAQDAGTAMRFLTAYYAFGAKNAKLIGSPRAYQRPIYILVDALNSIGANITYLEKKGYPPLLIKGSKPGISCIELEIDASISSQYISALLLIAPTLTNGVWLKPTGHISSYPYIEMTLQLLRKCGVPVAHKNHKIHVGYSSFQSTHLIIEKDWSAASYFYAALVLSDQKELFLNDVMPHSIQGDSILAQWFEQYFGIRTNYQENGALLERLSDFNYPSQLQLDFTDQPDLAQTVVVLCAALGISFHATGLHSLKIKETDRILALKNELEQLGLQVSITDHSLTVNGRIEKRDRPVQIRTYKDHRMAMAFAPLQWITEINFDDPTVVRKSFPAFWSEWEKLRFN